MAPIFKAKFCVGLVFILAKTIDIIQYRKELPTVAPTGVATQQIAIFRKIDQSAVPWNIPTPNIAPIMACEEETGIPRRVMNVIVRAAAIVPVTAVKTVCELRLEIVSRTLEPAKTAPMSINNTDEATATLNLTRPEATAVP
jgi:hypothetical protein